MSLDLQRLPRSVRFAAGAAGGLLIAACAVGVSAFATGHRIDAGGVRQPVGTPAAVAPPPGGLSPGAAAGRGQDAAGRGDIVSTEAEVLGIRPKTLTSDLESGQTVEQLAQQKGITEDQFRSALVAAVEASALPASTEQVIVERLQGGAIPYWSAVTGK